MVVIIDFGSQTSHLIARRIREFGVDTHIILPEDALSEIKKHKPKGIVFSGGPASVYAENAPIIEKEVFDLNIPILGICYGEQLISFLLGGNVKPGYKKEFGPATLTVTDFSFPITNSLPKEMGVWMNHGDEVVTPPPGFTGFAHTKTIPYAGIANEAKKIYAIQFHPEVIHTQFGETVLQNFLEVCGITPHKKSVDKKYVESLVSDIKDSVGNNRAICALSGGVDSSVAAVLVHEAMGDNLTAVYIDSGLMREGETDELEKTFKDHYKMNIKVVHAQDVFLKNLKDVTDPEEKRKVVGKTFIDVLEIEAKKTGATFLVQGTIYPDVIESAGSKHSAKIKSHHNVGGLPEKMNLSLIEPLRSLYKDEVREVGKLLKLPDSIVYRQPFPGPGLSIRIMGEVTAPKLLILRRADHIIQEEVKSAHFDRLLWQAFAVFTGVKTTGVRGDDRAYGETIALRAIEAKDAMSAHWAHLPYDLLEKISSRIVNEIPEVNRVVYDITTKPPATMEWE